MDQAGEHSDLCELNNEHLGEEIKKIKTVEVVDNVIKLMKSMKHSNMHYTIMTAFRARKSAAFLEATLMSSYT